MEYYDSSFQCLCPLSWPYIRIYFSVTEFFKSYELLLVTQKWDSVIKIINDIFPCVGKIVSRENGEVSQGLIPPFLKMLGEFIDMHATLI